MLELLLELSVLFSKGIQIDAAPEAGPLPSDHNDGTGIDAEVNARSGPTVDGVLSSFENPLLLTTGIPETNHGATNKANAGILRNRITFGTLASMIVLEDTVIGMWELEEPWLTPTEGLRAQQGASDDLTPSYKIAQVLTPCPNSREWSWRDPEEEVVSLDPIMDRRILGLGSLREAQT